MADTIDALELGGSWTDLNALSAIPVGTEIYIQNVGGPNDVIELALSSSQPSSSFRGIRVEQNSPMYKVDSGENSVWGRYIRLDRVDVGSRVTFVQIQEV